MADELGRVWSDCIGRALMIKCNRLKPGTNGDIYITQVFTPTGAKTINVVKRQANLSTGCKHADR
ncbi:MAG: hypothetical protein H7Z72_15130 [Bacteroidetes bacterium]|nr:hypothetical protein [Fibrella sp.]